MTTMPTFAPTKPWHETSAALSALVDGAVKAARDAEPPRTYLGASMMGRECLRSVAYEYHGVPKDKDREFTGRLYRVFDMGHDNESRMRDYLRMAGFDLRTHDDTGEEYAYHAADGRMQGHVDGVIFGGPAVPGIEAWPALWENKAVNEETFRKFQRYGVKAERIVYYAQAQIYMAYLGLDVCLFTAECRDNAEIHAEVIPFNVQEAQAISDAGVRVIVSDSPADFARIGVDETDFRCRFCSWRRQCWAPEIERRVSAAAPAWLKGETA